MKINKRLWVTTVALGIASAAVVAVKDTAHGEVAGPAAATPCPGAKGQQVAGGPATQVDLTVVDGGAAETSRDIQIHVASCSQSTVNARVESLAGASRQGADHSVPASEPRGDVQHPSHHDGAARVNASIPQPARIAG
ncbi:hypothetical protein J4P02_12580 [Pseudomonas sp. NFXW11]|uniref:hypothetical protein n=1 Tax=Pseudomonas sp. NFXW11 TaxID=2819531 RepID=UPI003CE6711C